MIVSVSVPASGAYLATVLGGIAPFAVYSDAGATTSVALPYALPLSGSVTLYVRATEALAAKVVDGAGATIATAGIRGGGVVPLVFQCDRAGDGQSYETEAALSGTYAERVQVSDGGLFVSVNGSDANDGLGPGSAKRTVNAAVTALPVGGGLVSVGGGLFTETPTPLPYGLTLRGQGRHTIISPASTGDLFTIPTNSFSVLIQDVCLHSPAGGGHLINGAADFSQSAFLNVYASQFNGAKSILKAATMIDVQWLGFTLECDTGNTRSTPMINLVSGGGGISHNLFQGGRVNAGPGAYVFHIEEPTAGSYAYNNRFADINFELADYGCVRALGYSGVRFDNIGVNDLTTTVNHLFELDKSATGSGYSHDAVFINVSRNGGTLGSGLRDIKLGAASNTTVISADTALHNGTFTIDWNGQSGVYYGIGATQVNDGAVMQLARYGAVRTGAAATGSRPPASGYSAGAQWFDTTLSKPIWSDGTVWRDAAGTAV